MANAYEKSAEFVMTNPLAIEDTFPVHIAPRISTMEKKVIIEAEGNLVKSMSNAGKHAVDAAIHAKDASVEKVREVAHDVDKNVHTNPWPYVAGTAAVGLLLGYILGRNRK